MHSIRLLALATALFAPFASAQQFTAGDIVVDHPWARATPKGATVGAGYLTVRNNGRAADALTAIESDAAGSAQMHESKMDGGVMRMDEISSLSIPPGGAVVFKPGGYHVMFVDLKAPLKKGRHFSATLNFEHAGKVAVDFTIEGPGASAPAKSTESMPGMEMK
jgi:periplasmic copper chaperone A